MRKVAGGSLSRSLIVRTPKELVTNQGLQALRKMDMIVEVVKSFWSILCNISSERASSVVLKVVTDVIYPEHDGEWSEMVLRMHVTDA